MLRRVGTAEAASPRVLRAGGLVIDDERQILDLIRHVLRRESISVDTAESGQAALNLLAKDSYDVIISEPSNPWISGIAYLFTDEFFAHVASKLHASGSARARPGGPGGRHRCGGGPFR